jgi:hypothetical protein
MIHKQAERPSCHTNRTSTHFETTRHKTQLHRRPIMEAVADEHGGPSANPPAASFYGEREYDSEKIRPDLTQTTILDGPFVGAKPTFVECQGRVSPTGPRQRVARMRAR